MFRGRVCAASLRLWITVALGVFSIAAAVLAPRPAWAEMDEKAAAEMIKSAYNVEVLKVRDGMLAGAPVWFVTVMKPGADTNDAFQVTTLAVDKLSGNLVSSFRHGPSGAVLSPGANPGTRGDNRPDSRSRVWR